MITRRGFLGVTLATVGAAIYDPFKFMPKPELITPIYDRNIHVSMELPDEFFENTKTIGYLPNSKIEIVDLGNIGSKLHNRFIRPAYIAIKNSMELHDNIYLIKPLRHLKWYDLERNFNHLRIDAFCGKKWRLAA